MDRESYEAGFRAAQQQSLQPQPQEGNDFLGALGKSAAGIGIAVGAGLAGRRLMRGRGATPEISKRDQVETNARTAATELSKRTGSLQTGVKLPPASEVAQTTGQSPRSMAPDPWESSQGGVSQGGLVGKRLVADQPTTQDRRLALPAAEADYEAPGRIDPQDFVSSQVQEARRQQASQDLLSAQQARTGSFQPEIPGVKGDLMAIRSKEGFNPQVTGEVTAPAESRPLSIAPEQKSLDFSKSYLQDKGYVDTPEVNANVSQQGAMAIGGTSTETQAARRPLVVEQSVEASDTAVDQMAGRIDRNIQRDIDVNLTEFQAIDSAATDRGADPVVAAQTAAKAVDSDFAGTQTDAPLSQSSAARFLAAERDEIASLLGEQGLPITPGRVEKELANRFGSEAYTYGPQYTKRKQNLQLGATYDPELFENMAKPTVRIAGEEVPTGRVTGIKTERTPYTNTLLTEEVELGLRQPTYMKETAEKIQQKAADKRDWLGSVRLEEASKNAKANAELINTNRQYNETLDYAGELNDFLDSKAGTPEQRTRARQRLDDTSYELDRLDARSEELNQRIYGGRSGARVRGAEKFTEDYIENLVPPSRLKPGIEEGQRVFFEVDETTGEPIPGTQELRSERKMVDMAPKGGGGRNVAEFSAGTRDEGSVDLASALQELRTPRNQSARDYEKDQFGYRPGTGLTGKALEGKPFTDDRTQTGRVVTRTGIQKSGPQEGSMAAAVNPFTQLDDDTLGMISLQGSESDAVNASRVLARRRREGYDPSTVTGPVQSQRIVTSVELTPKEKQTKMSSMDVSRKITALQRSGRPDAQQQVQKYIQELRGGL